MGDLGIDSGPAEHRLKPPAFVGTVRAERPWVAGEVVAIEDALPIDLIGVEDRSGTEKFVLSRLRILRERNSGQRANLIVLREIGG